MTLDPFFLSPPQGPLTIFVQAQLPFNNFCLSTRCPLTIFVKAQRPKTIEKQGVFDQRRIIEQILLKASLPLNNFC